MHRYWIVATLLILSGCKLVEAQEETDNAREAYKRCLAKYSSNVRKCEGAKLIYETNKEHLDSLIPTLKRNDSGTTYMNPVQMTPITAIPANNDITCQNFGSITRCH